MQQVLQIHTLKNRGFTLIELMISSAIMLISMLAISALVYSISKMQTKSNSYEWLDIQRQMTVISLNKPISWFYTIKNSQADVITCLRTASTCRGKSGYINVYDASGALLIESENSKAGFTINGMACSNFSPTEPQCPIRLAVFATPVCKDSECYELDSFNFQIKMELAQSAQDVNLLPQSSTINFSFNKVNPLPFPVFVQFDENYQSTTTTDLMIVKNRMKLQSIDASNIKTIQLKYLSIDRGVTPQTQDANIPAVDRASILGQTPWQLNVTYRPDTDDFESEWTTSIQSAPTAKKVSSSFSAIFEIGEWAPNQQ